MNLKNKWSLMVFFSIMSQLAFSLEGMITVLEAPVWKKPSESSTITQYLRRGDTVTIADLPVINSDFVPIWDSLTNTAYIHTKHLKIFTADAKELQTKSLNQDPTDYRMDEPIPSNYPIPHKQEGNIWYLFSR